MTGDRTTHRCVVQPTNGTLLVMCHAIAITASESWNLLNQKMMLTLLKQRSLISTLAPSFPFITTQTHFSSLLQQQQQHKPSIFLNPFSSKLIQSREHSWYPNFHVYVFNSINWMFICRLHIAYNFVIGAYLYWT